MPVVPEPLPPKPLRGVVRWMMVRVSVWRGRYGHAATGTDRALAVHAAAELLAHDAAAELGLEVDDVLRFAAERVFVWLGHRVAPRTFRAALACLPNLVAERAGEARLHRERPPASQVPGARPSILALQSGATSARTGVPT